MTKRIVWDMVISGKTGKCAAFDRNGNKLSGWYRDPMNLYERMERKAKTS